MRNMIEADVQHLIEYGLNITHIPEITQHVASVLSGFKDLIGREADYRAKWKFHYQELSLKPDHGLLPPKGEGYDQKHVLMYRRNLLPDLQTRFEYEHIERYMSMLGHLKAIQQLVYKRLLLIAAEFDRQYPGYNLKQHINHPKMMDLHAIRTVEYLYDPNAPEDKEFSAQPHVDLSVVTAQVFESIKGLVLQDYTGRIVEYEYDPMQGTVIIFMSDKMEQLTDGKLKAVPHAVMPFAKENRNSIICFAHTDHPTRELDGKHEYPGFREAVRKHFAQQLILA